MRAPRGAQLPRRERSRAAFGAAVEGLVLFVRDDIAEPNIGHADGRKFTPLLCSFFFFILVAALLGLMPFAATSTGNLAVTMGLALVSFAAQQYAGISKYGVVGHFHNLIPPGLPAWLLPIMIPVEILSMFTKPFALMIRLFANMLAGHMVITTLLLLLIALMGQIELGGRGRDGPGVDRPLALHHAARGPGRLHPGLHLHPALRHLHRHVRASRALISWTSNAHA